MSLKPRALFYILIKRYNSEKELKGKMILSRSFESDTLIKWYSETLGAPNEKLGANTTDCV